MSVREDRRGETSKFNLEKAWKKPKGCIVRRVVPVGPMFGCEGCCGVFAECVELTKNEVSGLVEG